MAQITEAIFTGGVLKPVGNLSLREAQRVRLIVEPLGDVVTDRAEALKRLLTGLDSMQFFSTGKLPSRDELHDRI
jgi:predicted DNA-binding antitoxin AbrB/MazE fold protein